MDDQPGKRERPPSINEEELNPKMKKIDDNEAAMKKMDEENNHQKKIINMMLNVVQSMGDGFNEVKKMLKEDPEKARTTPQQTMSVSELVSATSQQAEKTKENMITGETFTEKELDRMATEGRNSCRLVNPSREWTQETSRDLEELIEQANENSRRGFIDNMETQTDVEIQVMESAHKYFGNLKQIIDDQKKGIHDLKTQNMSYGRQITRMNIRIESNQNEAKDMINELRTSNREIKNEMSALKTLLTQLQEIIDRKNAEMTERYKRRNQGLINEKEENHRQNIETTANNEN